MLRKSSFLTLITLVAFSSSLFADQVTLKNGDRLTGEIVKSDAKTLVLKTEAAGDVTFQWSAIDGVTSTQRKDSKVFRRALVHFQITKLPARTLE